MGRLVTIGLVQMQWKGSRETMLDAHEASLRAAVEGGADVVAFQELFNAQYFCQVQDDSFLESAEVIPDGPTVERFRRLAAELEVVLVLPVFEQSDIEGIRFNSAAVIDADGTFLGCYRKQHIPQLPGFFEKYYFRPGDGGYPVFNTRVGRIGVYICYDRHFPEGWRSLALNGAEIVFNPVATSRSLSYDLWELEARAAAAANAYFVAAVNRVGVEPLGDSDFYGRSYIASPTGEIVAGPASTQDDDILVHTIDLGEIASTRSKWQWFRDRRPDTYSGLVVG